MNNKKKDSAPRLVDSGEGLSVFYRNIFLYPEKAPSDRTVSIVSRLEPEEKTLYIIPSPLLFYGIAELNARLPDSSKIVCVEFDKSLYALSTDHNSCSDIPYFCADSLPKMLSCFDSLDFLSFRKIRQIILSRGYNINRSLYSALVRNLDETLSTFWKNKMTMIYMSRMWINNIFLNLPYLGGSSSFSEFLTDKPVLVIGAGESLEEQIEDIRRNRERLYLLCVDTALPVLSQKGIIPDAVIVLEAQHVNLYDFFGSCGCSGITLFYDINSHHKIHSLFTGKKIPFLSEFATVKLFSELAEYRLLPEIIPPLGSVGLAALYIGRKLTSGVCGFIGLDFSYRPGKPHSRGTESHKRLLMRFNKLGSADYLTSSFERHSRHYDGLKPDFHSDPVLAFYCRQCSYILAEGNYADCGTGGFTGHDKKMTISALASSSSSAMKNSAESTSSADMFSVARAVSFLKKKKAELQSIRKLIEDKKYAMTAETAALLTKNDFIYADFPEKDIFALDSRIIMARIFTSIDRYQKTIGKALIIALENTEKG